jgi:hypothetical protein
MAREILAELRSHFADKIFDTVVNFNTKIKEASSFGQPVCEYDPASRGQKDFRALAEEIIDSPLSARPSITLPAVASLDGQADRQQPVTVSSLADQLETISTSADELLRSAKPPIKAQPAASMSNPQTPQLEKPKQADTNVKLSDYYGVSQLNDALVFVTLYPRANNVQVAGDFNSWQPSKNPLQKIGNSGVWQTKMKLPPGKYRYRLVVDGQWQQDPYNAAIEVNPFGGFNSVVEVK